MLVLGEEEHYSYKEAIRASALSTGNSVNTSQILLRCGPSSLGTRCSLSVRSRCWSCCPRSQDLTYPSCALAPQPCANPIWL